MLWPNASTLDEGLDMVDMVHRAFHHYDIQVQFNGTNFVLENGEGVGTDAPSAAPDLGGTSIAYSADEGVPSSSSSMPPAYPVPDVVGPNPKGHHFIPDPVHNDFPDAEDDGHDNLFQGPSKGYPRDLEEGDLEDGNETANLQGSCLTPEYNTLVTELLPHSRVFYDFYKQAFQAPQQECSSSHKFFADIKVYSFKDVARP
jgi:hypothetical protein